MIVQYGYVDTPESSSLLVTNLLPLGFLLEPGAVQIFVPADTLVAQFEGPAGALNTEAECGAFYTCLLGNLPTRPGGLDWSVDLADTLPTCMENAYTYTYTATAKQKRQDSPPPTPPPTNQPSQEKPEWGLQCPLSLTNLTSSDQAPCADNGFFDLSIDNYKTQANTDLNLQIFLHGGIDLMGVFWPPKPANATITQALGRAMGKRDYDCSLSLPCQPASELDCKDVGPRQAGWKEVVRCRWGYFALTALENISQRLTTAYTTLNTINISSILDGFKIDDFRPKGGTKFPDLGFLKGVGAVMGVVAGFAPAALPRTTPSGAILEGQGMVVAAVSEYLGASHAGSEAKDVEQEDFVEEVEKVVEQMKGALGDVVQKLFSGEPLDGGATLFDMLRDGAWVNASTIPNLGDVGQQLRVEILSRAVNELWTIFSSNKRWVLFVNLQDDPGTMKKCEADVTGPQDLKYCADGGVYYTYNFIETGNHEGKVGYPWGAEKLKDLGIDMRVSPRPLLPPTLNLLSSNDHVC